MPTRRSIDAVRLIDRADKGGGIGPGSPLNKRWSAQASARSAVSPATKIETPLRNEGTAPGTTTTPLAEASAAAALERAAQGEPPVRNEATASGTSNGESRTQPDAKLEVTPNAETKSGVGSGRILRNEAKAVTMAGPHRRISGGKAWDHSRRARRARAANERASGSGVVEKALDFQGTARQELANSGRIDVVTRWRRTFK